jgi:membrane-associated phospholipid phosphatase
MLSALGVWVDRPGGKLNRRRVLLALAIGYALFIATYVPINGWSVGRPAHILFLPGEERLPFIPDFEYVYLLVYPLPLLMVFFLADARGLQRAAVAFAIVCGIAYATYIVFPVTFVRPTFASDTIAKWLLAMEYRDPSYNHFPSLHVALAWLIYLACRPGLRRSGWLVGLVAAISASTLFVKQHYLADVAYGLALACGAWAWSGRIVRRALGEERP